ncbi:Cell division protein FtsQ [Corynebacterium atrinae]|uniref:cell division protein FtsQ/DivIB n=1 Tax=Corynebacterium atrinae TaxID=1336740 RepID=UPI0025B37291|nr:FtsQ-type POTRA domain-containing protein [Corynebacterium atrinae]WJY63809.1 Cell division protein FtsQ [Corynebacterium atrinae]
MTRKRILAAIAAVVLVVVVAIGAVWAFPVFTVKGYEVTGNVHTSQEDIVSVTGVGQGQNLARIDAGAAAAKVVTLPWVKSATVSQQWPSTLGVEVVERQAVLYSVEGDGDHLIDEAGLPFVIDVPPEEAVEVTGAERQEPEVLKSVASVVAQLPEPVRLAVARVDVPARHDLTFYLHDGRTVYWGSTESAHDKALAMEDVLGREGQAWNVSNPSLVTVR